MDQKSDKKGMSPMAAGVTGAVIGAGIAAAATKVLTDEKMKQKIKATVSDAKEKAVAYAHTIRMEAKRARRQAEGQIKKGRRALKRT